MSQRNGSASQNESKWKFQWHKDRTVANQFEFQVVHGYVFIVV